LWQPRGLSRAVGRPRRNREDSRQRKRTGLEDITQRPALDSLHLS